MLTDAIDLSQLRRVLVIKLRHHGDVLLTSPVFSTLKNHAPHLKIDALLYQDTAEMLTLHPAIEEIHTIDRAWKRSGLLAQAKQEWALLSRLRSKHYDLVIHLSEHPRGAWVKRLTGARYGVAPSLVSRSRWWKSSFSHFFPWLPGNTRHTVEIHLDALRRIGLQPSFEERRLVLEPGLDAKRHITEILAAQGLSSKAFIHLHPTSRWLFKCWAEDKVTALMQALQAQGHTLLVSSAPDARELAMLERILRPLAQPVVNLGGQLTLKQLAALTAQAKLFIGVDSAPMHIAAAMQTPVLALFGPSGEKEWGPWMVPHRVITSDHPCRPCGQDGCGGGKISECLTTLPVERVLQAVDGLLSGA
ncbi:MAG: putative lipopolysaccharide heptosyltransferase III [Burkholderiales bacterium]|nr:putative lipopolysaccharide heptosyltransferase III [Burkholderiales bacterium]